MLRNIVSEGVLIGRISWIIGVLCSLPVSLYVGRLVGSLAFRSPLPLALSPIAVVLWLALITAGAALASAYPAWRASRLTIRDTLDYM
jgi:putative ABC transport system permease protein